MIQTTGFKKLKNDLYVKDALIQTSIYLAPLGEIQADLHFINPPSTGDTINHSSEIVKEFVILNRSELIYNNTIVDTYDRLLNAVEIWLINNYLSPELTAKII